ncbi:MAG: hypothetical protein NT157_05160, partial [Candidatus Micrarchaeota archaeon]|nr:hypothetical protein [Candidatus Micrarchaeota archaeon]
EQLFSAMWQLCAIGKQYEALVFTHNVLEKDSGQAYLFSGYVNLTAEGVAVKLKQCAQEAVGCVKKLAELAQKDGGQLDFAWEKARFTLIEGGAPAELLRNALAFAETTSRKLRANVLAEIGAAIINLEWSPNKPPAPRGLDLEYMPLYAQVALAR